MIEEEVTAEHTDTEESWFTRLIMKVQTPEMKRNVYSTLVSIVLALLVAAGIMVFTGHDPLEAYGALFLGAILQFDKTLYNATPLVLAGLSVALAFKCGLFNIGAEGQLYMGSIVTTAVAYMISLPIVVHQVVCLTLGVLAGMAYGFLPGLLKAYRGAHEVVTTMMMSYASVLLTQWLVSQGPMHNPGDWRSITPVIFDSATLPKLFGSAFLNWGFFLAIGAVIFVEFLINRTALGYELRAVGANEEAARTAGINSKRNIALALGISGGLAGLAGSEEILGYYHRFYDGWSGGLGFDGVTVAVLGRNNPWGVLGGALFFGFLKAGGGNMQTFAGVPSEMVNVIQGLVVLFVAAPRLVDWLAKHGVGYAQVLKDNPRVGAPQFALLIYSIFSIVFSFLAFNVLSIINLLISLVALAYLYMRDEFGVWLAAITSIVWILLGVLTLAGVSIAFVSIMIGVVGLVLFVWYERVREANLNPMSQGGES
ncbi:MAG: hypothetical protein DRP09_03960 [Candidatus Thorarchaeota archaeon]|nr:MAG: hypothetical protein DRP09_03960 [Candidatus Thorarchaeota archaeon]